MLLLPLLLFMPGCVAVVAGAGAAGGVAYVRGELQAVLDQPAARVNEAVRAAGEALELQRISSESDRLGGKFVYRNARDEKIVVTSEAQTASTTQLGIRVGVFGDQTQSQLILDRIRKQL